jgi:hypothetical protein
MALINIDEHILLQLVILQQKEQQAAVEFKQQWEIISSVRDKTETIVLGDRNADHPDLPSLRNRIFRAMKVCNTKMVVMDDCMSRTAALLQHLVKEVKEERTNV